MNRDDKLREIIGEMRSLRSGRDDSPPPFVTDWADRIEGALSELAPEHQEAVEVCGEAFLVVGRLLSDVGMWGSEHGDKIMGNLFACRMVHKDVLPWPAFFPVPEASAWPCKKVVVYRSKATGRIVSKHYAKSHPNAVTKESIAAPIAPKARRWVRAVTGE